MKHKVKKLIKAAAPYGVVVLWRRHESNRKTPKLNYCPVCEKWSEFIPAVNGAGLARKRGVCTNCGTLERHRLTWLFINRKVGLDSMKNKSMLHVAAEQVFEQKFRKIVGRSYLTADYLLPADVKMDITDIQFKDNSFDIIMCNHVLEHVTDDIKAMKEMYRVLKPAGWAIFLVPIADTATTYENTKVKTDAGRLKHFGQIDHVRKYGRDYVARLESAGWKVKIYDAKEVASTKEIKQMGLVEDEKNFGFTPTEIFYCTK